MYNNYNFIYKSIILLFKHVYMFYKMSINYIIATYNGINKRKHSYPLPENVLKCHLEKINSFNHSLSQITIMKAKSENYYENYYDIDDTLKQFDIPVKIIECENYGYSMGQWLKAYENNRTFDYYIFIEDDYCPNINNFDSIIMESYKKKTQENVGILCSIVLGQQDFSIINSHYPIHFDGAVFLSKRTLEILYSFEKFEGNPIEFLDTVDSTIDPNFNWGHLRRGYIGGYYQVVFSHLFTMSGVRHIYFNNNGFPFWIDNKNKNGGEIIFFQHGEKDGHKKYTLENIEKSIFIPVQLANKFYIHKNTHIKIPEKHIIFIIGMHRCGTSLLSNCISKNGFYLGKNESTVKDIQNPCGYYENTVLTDFHTMILKYNNSSWYDIRITDMAYTEQMVYDYRKLLVEQFGDVTKILIKDPRLTFFRSFIIDVCTSINSYNFIFLTRDKIECVKSLCKAQNISENIATKLFDITNYCYTDSYIKINYKDILYKNSYILKKLSNFCQFDIERDTTDIVDIRLYRNSNIKRIKIVIGNPLNPDKNPYFFIDILTPLIEFFKDNKIKIDIIWNSDDIDIKSGDLHIGIFNHVPTMKHMPKNYIMYNLEPLQNMCLLYEEKLKNAMMIINLYNNTNLTNYIKKINKCITYIPMCYHKKLENMYNVDKCEEDIDVLFYGSMNTVRENVINTLRENGINVFVAPICFGKRRDEYIHRSKIVLLSTYYDDSYETIRTIYMFSNKKCIVSVKNKCNDDIYKKLFPDLFPNLNVDDLVIEIKTLLSDAGKRVSMGINGYNYIKKNMNIEQYEETINNLLKDCNTYI